jgi:hypothetical protein
MRDDRDIFDVVHPGQSEERVNWRVAAVMALLAVLGTACLIAPLLRNLGLLP